MRRDETAVSAVVGAVLLLALFSTVATIYTVETLPQWKADKEQNQQAEVAGVLAALRADVEALAARGDAGPVTAPVPLETPRVPLLQPSSARASLEVEDGFDATFAFGATPSLFLSGGASAATPALTSGVLPSAPCSGKCVQSLESFILGVATSGVTGTVTGTVTFVDSAASPATVTATVSHIATGGTCPGEVRLTVGSAQTPLLCTGSGTAVGSTSSPYRIDLLSSAYTLGSTLARLTPPFSVSFSTGGAGPGTMTLGHAMVYDDSTGLLRVTGTGTSTTTPVQPIDGKRLVYSPRYESYPGQDLVLEGGALVVDGGSTFQAITGEAPFSAAVSASGVGSLTWTLIDFDGAGSIGGARAATVGATFDSVEDVVFTLGSACPMASPCASIVLTTPSAQAWGSFLDLQAGLGGVEDSLDTTVDSVTGTARLDLASGAGLAVTGGWVVHLRVIHATLDVS